MIAIEAFDAVAVGRAKMLEATVLERTVEVITLVVRPVVAEPVVLVDMRGAVHAARVMTFGVGLRRRSRNGALVGARPILPAVLTALRAHRERHDESHSKGDNQPSPHVFASHTLSP